MTADHAPYIHAVARHLSDAGFYVRSVGGHDWPPRGGHIELGCQDGWDDYDRGDADLLWDEATGWRLRWGGLTDFLSVPTLATPATVALAIGHVVGQTAARVDGETFDSVRAEPGTPEFDAALAAYDTERTPQ
jgi:hypothetical protein